MSAFKKMRLHELQAECQALGLDYTGLNKRGLVQLLQNQAMQAQQDIEGDFDGDGQTGGSGMDENVNEDDEVSFRAERTQLDNAESAVDGPTASGMVDGSESDEVRVMRLKLALAQEERLRERERDDRARQMKELDWRIERERAELNGGPTPPATFPAARSDMSHILPKMSEDDILTFFSSFERSLTLNAVQKCDWPKFLASCLTVKANKVLSGLSLAENQNFDKCKSAILQYFRLDSAAYQKKFRQARKASDETFKMFTTRIKDYYQYYLEAKGLETFEALKDDAISEQLLSVLSPEIRNFVMSKQPSTSDECCRYADLYLEMSRNSGAGQGADPPLPTGVGHPARKQAPVSQTLPPVVNGVYRPTVANRSNPPATAAKQIRCFLCNEIGHKRSECPNPKATAGICSNCQQFHPFHISCNARAGVYAAELEQTERCDDLNDCAVYGLRDFRVPVTVNDCELLSLRDTGCSLAMIVDPKYVSDCQYIGRTILCRGAFDNDEHKRSVQLACVQLRAPTLGCARPISVTAAVWPLPNHVDCLIGNGLFTEFPFLTDVVQNTPRSKDFGDVGAKPKGGKTSVTPANLSQGAKGWYAGNTDSKTNGQVTSRNKSNAGRESASNGQAKISAGRGRAEVTQTDGAATLPAIAEAGNESPQRMVGPLRRLVDAHDGQTSANGNLTDVCDIVDPTGDETTQADNSARSGGNLVACSGGSAGSLMSGDTAEKGNHKSYSSESGTQVGRRDGGELITETVGTVVTRAAARRTAVEQAESVDGNLIGGAASRRSTATAGTQKCSVGGSPDSMQQAGSEGDGSAESDSPTAVTGSAMRPLPTEVTPTDDSSMLQALTELGRIDISSINRDAPVDVDEHSISAQFKHEQQLDAGLQAYWQRANAGSNEFRVLAGLLYKRSGTKSDRPENEYVLVLPQTREKEVIRIAHNTVMGAHQGVNRTLQRVAGEFFFPKMKRKIARHVKSCRECQLVRGVKIADRQPMQNIGTMSSYPFQHLMVDILGTSLPTTARKNKYILTIVCCASGWIEARAIKNCKAETIANELLSFFCDKSFPIAVTSDNFSAFKGEIMKAVSEKLGIKHTFSAPFHPQSHSVAERANRTLLETLKRCIHDSPKEWDLMLPFICFGLREVPNRSSNFSPFQLVYGHKGRGLLTLLRDELEGRKFDQNPLKISTVKYMESLEAKIKAGLEAAAENQRATQAQNKAYFDRKSTVRSLNPGDDALVLMPDNGTKLMARWCGPFRVLRKLPNNNYHLDIRGREALLHMNSLRRYVHDGDDDQNVDDGGPDENPNTSTVAVIISDDRDAMAEAADGECQPAEEASDANDYTMGEQLTPGQRAAIKELMATYADLFTADQGTTHLAQHTITLTDPTPSYQPSYPIPLALREQVRCELEDMQRRGIIVYDPHAQWNSPLVIVRKPDGKLRLCNNFVELNRRSQTEPYTMTNSSELLNKIAGAKFISRVDLKSAFHQIPLDPLSQPFTSFHTPYGVYKYLKMPFGLKNASACLQRLMDQILKGAHRYADKLLDDIVVWSNDFQLHLTQLADVFDRIRSAQLTLNSSKCCIATNRLRIFGYLVDNGKIIPDPEKIKAIAQWPVPRTKKQLSSFVGLTGYFRSSIMNYAQIVLPLMQLTARYKPEKLVWGATEQAAFEALKNALISRPVLYPADPNKDYEIYADASQTTLGAICLQRGDGADNTPRVISYASRKLLPREQNYPSIEREILSIVFALAKFHIFVYGKRITLKSDCRPLLFLNSIVKRSPRLARWIMAIQQYDLDLQWVKGDQQLADVFTRQD